VDLCDQPRGRRDQGQDCSNTDARFASAILLRPFQVNKHKKDKQANVPEKTQYEQQVELKRRMKTMLENEQLIPRVSGKPPRSKTMLLRDTWLTSRS
jgi:hypothetical protein